MKRFLALFLFCSPLVTVAQSDSLFIRQLADEVLVNSQAYPLLRTLTKQVGPRLAGSPGMVKAEQWGADAMKKLGADKIILQECLVPHWVRGEEFAYALQGSKKTKLDIVGLGNSLGSAKAIVANVVEVGSFEELDQLKDVVKDKIVFFNIKFNQKYVRTFEAYRDAVKYRSQAPSAAAKYGALAVIVRSMSHSTDNNPHTGATRYDSLYKKIPAVAIGLKDADWLSTELKKRGLPLRIELKTSGKFLPDAIGHNIVGELTGTQFPNEVITIGGHLDSWDNCEGAHDDGAGCVQTLEILHAFKAMNYQPKRTIRFVLFANEENGLRGGTAYAADAKKSGNKYIFALESDAGGFTPRGFGFTVSDKQFEKIAPWKSLIAPYGAGDFGRSGGGSDIGPLNRELGTAVAGLSPDSQRYFDLHHARNDVFEAVNKRELDLGALNMAILVYLVDQYGL